MNLRKLFRSHACFTFNLLLLLSGLVSTGAIHAQPVSKDPKYLAQIGVRQDVLTLTLQFAAPIGETNPLQVRLQVLNPGDVIIASAATEVSSARRQKQLVLRLDKPFARVQPGQANEIEWLRLKYEVRTSTGEILASGIESLHTPETDQFVLTAAAGRVTGVGRWYEVPVHTRKSGGAPVRGATVHGTITWDAENGEQKLVSTVVTDSAGDGSLRFFIPARAPAGSGDLTVEAQRGLIVRTLDHNVEFRSASILLLDTDKDIYQPGQTLRARVLLFDAERRALPRQPLDVRVTDEENTLVSSQTVTSDAFGVAHFDWGIPANVLLGQYRVAVGAEKDDDSRRQNTASKSVHIYRYDLPNFKVTAKPDRPYYLPTQNAEVLVSAEYLFNQPVTRGRVRVVVEKERRWNYRKQQWETEEEQVQSGILDRDGHFNARFDLTPTRAKLSERGDDAANFRDLDLAAYVTDLTTGHTEQRRFSLRVTRDPIHVYAIKAGSYQGYAADAYYISTFYADGTPARCKVRLSQADSDDPSDKQLLRTLETNRYGLAKVTGLVATPKGGDSLVFEASDHKGLGGSYKTSVYQGDDQTTGLEITTSHTIHKKDEGIEVTLRSNKTDLRAVVEASREGVELGRQQVRLRNGRAHVVFPYDQRFTDEINITAYSLEERVSVYSYLERSVTVLFPKNRRLAINVQFDKDEHRPGEAASVRFAVHTPDQTGAESALGVKIVDSAVEERARTDGDFGGQSSGSWGWALFSEGYHSTFAGVSRDDLDQIDLDQPVPHDLDLVAEYLLRNGSRDTELLGHEARRTADAVFGPRLTEQFQLLDKALQRWNERNQQPHNQAELAELAMKDGLDLLGLRDPWGTPYRYETGFAGDQYFVKAHSAGPDKRMGTADDFIAKTLEQKFFLYYGNILEKASKDLMEKQGRFIRDRGELRAEMLKKGVDIELLRDPWGSPYDTRFLVVGSTFETQVVSHGEDPKDKKKSDGEVVWQDRVDYFATTRQHFDQVLTAHLRSGGRYPENEAEFRSMLRKAGVDLGELRDPWGTPYYIIFKKASEYGDRVTIQQSSVTGRRVTEPVTLIRKEVRVMSAGNDKTQDTDDDFQVAAYTVLLSGQGSHDQKPVPEVKINLMAGDGALTGTVTDPTGAVIPDAIVEAIRDGSGETTTVKTNEDGRFELINLKPGIYKLLCKGSGFQLLTVSAVPVQAEVVTSVDLQLWLGEVMETVEVTAGPPPVMETTSSTISSASLRSLPLTRLSPGLVKGAASRMAMSTPRLREDFPETMLWEPAVITDSHGKTRLNFKLADSITNWKLTAFASTKTGEFGTAEKYLRAFQPFFIEHDPPRILTQGDEIAYPVVLRNYLERAQTLKAWIKPATWFQSTGPSEVPVTVAAGDAGRAIFRYRVTAPITGGKQQVGAANAEISDAAQKPVDVHPYGRPASATASTVMQKTGALTLQLPPDTIAGSMKATVKVYPNLLAHVIENLEAGLERPNGCGEQTISSTYPSLLVTEIYEKSAKKPPVALKARRYLQAGYERLLRYQDLSGGFTYWGTGIPDSALTTYALEFLHHAGRLIDVDSDVVLRAQHWLLARQEKDGSWRGHYDKSDKGATMQTAYVAQGLDGLEEPKGPQPAVPPARQKALAFLAAHSSLIDEPYVIAEYALAAKAAGDQKTFVQLVDGLRTSVHYENHAAYWQLERNTPFYVWGAAGRVESTAEVLRALTAAGTRSASDDELIRQGLIFLLRNEAKDGMWFSGQTTVHVLKTLLKLVVPRVIGPGARLSVVVNHKAAATIDLPPGQGVTPPIEVDVSQFVIAGENQAELAVPGEGMISAQFVVESFVEWPHDAGAVAKTEVHALSTLKFDVDYSSTRAATGDNIECRVRTERIGYRGYGMMLGEVGLPPGAEVDRESLELALKGNSSLYRYDVLPDRVILYLWPSAGGSDLTFKFRPRFAMQAQTAPSQLYDYYNPDSSVTVKPTYFDITEGIQPQAAPR